MKGYKATDKDGKCRGIEFKVGKVYEVKDKLELCKNGFHFCGQLLDVYNYYEKTKNTRVFEVEALGEILTEQDKSCTNKLKIIRELSRDELLDAVLKRGNSGNRNSGDWNSGDGNSGNRNSGNRNSGHGNSGNRNSGYGNSGHGNSGNRNSGDWNSGHGNSGNRNSGDWNSGDGNSGSYNRGNRNTGYFNTKTPLYFFNKPSDLEWSQDLENKMLALNVKPVVEYVATASMTEEEKKANPSHSVTGGFLRKTDRMSFSSLTEKDKEFIKSLPNYDDNVFKEISGISLEEPKEIEVEHNGKKFKLNLQKAKELGLLTE